MARTSILPVILGAAVAVGAAFTVTVALPTADAANTDLTDATRVYAAGGERGMEVYVNQGCVLCHTQQVRDSATDGSLAERPTRPGDTLGDRPGQLGSVRFGPDLACVGDRFTEGDDEAAHTAAVAAMVAYLREPAAVHAGSTMPAYDHLTDAQLTDLAGYLVSLHCEQGAGE